MFRDFDGRSRFFATALPAKRRTVRSAIPTNRRFRFIATVLPLPAPLLNSTGSGFISRAVRPRIPRVDLYGPYRREIRVFGPLDAIRRAPASVRTVRPLEIGDYAGALRAGSADKEVRL